MYSLGLGFGENGNVTAVQWDGPAFNQGVTVGTQVVAVNGVSLQQRVAAPRRSRPPRPTPTPIELLLQERRSVSDRHDRLSRRPALSASRARRGDERPAGGDSGAAFTLTAAARVLNSRAAFETTLACGSARTSIDPPLILAPMAGVTDKPFRLLCKRLGAGYAVSEMTTADPRLWRTRKSAQRLDHEGEPAPIGVQIAGADPARSPRPRGTPSSTAPRSSTSTWAAPRRRFATRGPARRC